MNFPFQKRPLLVAVWLVLSFTTVASAQHQAGSSAAEPMAVDSRISTALQQVSAATNPGEY